ncbi:hypothetical protein BG000_007671 [Podila horticola]|nr:hypothetical protein BG000_007671 [Podila horticola]
MEHTHSQSAPSSTTQPSTDIGDDFGDLDDALLSKILDDDDELDPPTTSQTSSGNQSGKGQHTATATTPVDTPSSGSSVTQLDAEDSALLSSDDEDCRDIHTYTCEQGAFTAELSTSASSTFKAGLARRSHDLQGIARSRVLGVIFTDRRFHHDSNSKPTLANDQDTVPTVPFTLSHVTTFGSL